MGEVGWFSGVREERICLMLSGSFGMLAMLEDTSSIAWNGER
jgi:hypothetical protein